jgi:hypothetical protein
MAGQVALHWRARHLGAESVTEAAALAPAPAPTPTPTPVIAPPVAERPAAAASDIAPAMVAAPAAAPAEVVLAPVESPAVRVEDLGVSEARTHSRAPRRQIASAPVAMESGKEGNGKEGNGKEGNGREVTLQGSGRETGANRRTAAEISKKRGRTVWIDPFADDGEAPAGSATDRGAPGMGSGQPIGRGVDSVGQLTSPVSASGSPPASRSAPASRALTARGPRWVDPFAE